MSDIYSRTPINKTAALVTSQKDCSNSELTEEQKRVNLVSRYKSLNNKIVLLEKGPERKALGKEIAEVCSQINQIRPKKKSPGVERYVIEILREELTKYQFNRLFDKANKRMKEDLDRE